MDFDFTVPGLGTQLMTCWDAASIRGMSAVDLRNFKLVVDAFGKRSAIAQKGLNAPITDIPRLRSTDQRLFLCATRQGAGTTLLGGLKVGTKRLFVSTDIGAMHEIEPMCVLDFYVHETCQRQGIGRQLFEHFLQDNGHEPASLAYDRPSSKFLAFLRRYYGLSDFVLQSNNFVVFTKYWHIVPGTQHTSSRKGTGIFSTRQQSVQPSPHSSVASSMQSSSYSSQNIFTPVLAVAPEHALSVPYGQAVGCAPLPVQSSAYVTQTMGQRWSQGNVLNGGTSDNPPPAPSSGPNSPMRTSYQQQQQQQQQSHGASPRPAIEDSIDRFQADAVARRPPQSRGLPLSLGHAPDDNGPSTSSYSGSCLQQAPAEGRISARLRHLSPSAADCDPYQTSSKLMAASTGMSATPDFQPTTFCPSVLSTPKGASSSSGNGWSKRSTVPWAEGGHWSAPPMQRTAHQPSMSQQLSASTPGLAYPGAQSVSARQQHSNGAGLPSASLLSARAAAVQQRSGAGAANCLVW